MTDLHGDQISTAGGSRRPDPRRLRPAVVDLAEPGHAARRAGDRGRRRSSSRVLARAQASRLRARRTRVRARLPALSGHRLADAERIPSRRTRDAAPALRLLVPRRRPAAALHGAGDRSSACKEEIALVVAGFGIWYALSHKRWVAGAAIAASAGLWAAVAIARRDPALQRRRGVGLLRALQRGRRLRRRHPEDAFTHPLRIVEAAFSARDLHYLLELVAPLAGLCLLAPLVLVAALPELAINLLSSTTTQTSIHFHYTAGLIPPLIIAAIFGAKRLSRWLLPIGAHRRAGGTDRQLPARADPGLAACSRRPAVPGDRRARDGSRPDRGASARRSFPPAPSSARRTRSAHTCPHAVASSAFRSSRTRSGSPPTRHSRATRIVTHRFRPRCSSPRYDGTRSGTSCSRKTGSSSFAARPCSSSTARTNTASTSRSRRSTSQM